MFKRKSIRYKVTFTFILSLLISFIIYLLLLLILNNTEFYQNFSTLINLVYWALIIILQIAFVAPLFESITDPLNNFNAYLKNFNSINFKDLSRKLETSELIILAKSLAELQTNMQETVNQLEEKNQEISRLNEEQKKDYQYKQELISSLSHDIKTPLTVIQTTISAIIDGIFPPDETNNELKNVLLQIEHTNNMIQDAMAIFKLENETSVFDFEEFNLTELIIEATNNFSKLIEKHQHKLVLSLPHEVKIYADKKQFQRVLNNLITNAIVHSPEGNEIRINIYRSKNNNVLEIINTGVKIPQDEIEKIFEPFYMLDKSRTKTTERGNGLGLFIVKQILTKLHFDIGVSSLENGVKFYILIPKK